MKRLALAALIGLAIAAVIAWRWEQDEWLPNVVDDTDWTGWG